jgi:hypothetical protein
MGGGVSVTQSLLIAFDYDGVVSEDVGAWRAVARALLNSAHRCVLITSRPESAGEVVTKAMGDLMPILFVDGQTKIIAAQAQGYSPDVWIDDNPGGITRGWNSTRRALKRRELLR